MGTLIVDTIGGRNNNSPTQSDGLIVTGVGTATAGFSGNIVSTAGTITTLSATTITATTVTTTGNVSVGGTLTYDDVTNIDSVGMITAQGGINVSAGNVKVNAGIVTVGAGVTISSDFIHLRDNSKINLGISSDLQIWHDGSHSQIKDAGSGGMHLWSGDFRFYNAAGTEYIIKAAENASVDLYYDSSKKIETISTGASVYGGLRLHGGGLIRENLNISATALNSNSVINLSDGMVHYRSSAVGGANVKLNVISNAGVNTDMAIGDILAVTVITVAGSASHFVDQIRIDGVEATAGVTTNWSGGSAPSDGGTTGIDSYAFNVMKTGNATYVLLANQTKTS
jgi:hypothetical protein